jgi:hypothetical protein
MGSFEGVREEKMRFLYAENPLPFLPFPYTGGFNCNEHATPCRLFPLYPLV